MVKDEKEFSWLSKIVSKIIHHDSILWQTFLHSQIVYFSMMLGIVLKEANYLYTAFYTVLVLISLLTLYFDRKANTLRTIRDTTENIYTKINEEDKELFRLVNEIVSVKTGLQLSLGVKTEKTDKSNLH